MKGFVLCKNNFDSNFDVYFFLNLISDINTLLFACRSLVFLIKHTLNNEMRTDKWDTINCSNIIKQCVNIHRTYLCTKIYEIYDQFITVLLKNDENYTIVYAQSAHYPDTYRMHYDGDAWLHIEKPYLDCIIKNVQYLAYVR